LKMAERRSFSPVAKSQKVVDQHESNLDMESVRMENEALKEENLQLKLKVRELEKQQEEETKERKDASCQAQAEWELCSDHDGYRTWLMPWESFQEYKRYKEKRQEKRRSQKIMMARWLQPSGCLDGSEDGSEDGCSDSDEEQEEDRNSCPHPFCSGTTFEHVSKIPHLVENIFSHLDMKSYVDCRMVSKTWKSLIDDSTSNLHVAAGTGNVERVAKLIAGGADVNAKLKSEKCVRLDSVSSEWISVEDRSPLHVTATCSLPQHVEIGKLLIEGGAELESKDKWFMTPLHAAAKEGGDYSGEFLKMLIKAGADVNGSPEDWDVEDEWDLEDPEGPLDPPSFPLIAAIRNLGPVYKNFWDSDRGYFCPKYIASKPSDNENIKILVEAGADVNCHDGDDCTALGCLLGQILRKGACEWNGLEEMDKDLQLVDLMIDAGADKLEIFEGDGGQSQ